MAKKKYYESGKVFLKIEESLKKYNDLCINSLSKDSFTAKLSLGIEPSEEMFNLKKDSVNGKNILMLHVDCSFVQSSSIFLGRIKKIL